MIQELNLLNLLVFISWLYIVHSLISVENLSSACIKSLEVLMQSLIHLCLDVIIKVLRNSQLESIAHSVKWLALIWNCI